MMSREILLRSIKPDMKLTKAFFLQIYGYELTWPGFAKEAIERLKMAGCSKAEEYYNNVASEQVEKYERTRKSIAEYLRQHKDERGAKWKSKEKQQEVEQLKTGLQKKSDRELLILLQRLRTENIL